MSYRVRVALAVVVAAAIVAIGYQGFREDASPTAPVSKQPEAVPDASSPVAPPADPTDQAQAGAPSGKPMPPEEAAFRARYAALLELYRAERYKEAYDGYYALAKEWPHGGTLGMVVASLASTAPTKERALALGDKADADPSNVLDQFVAGVSSHYYAHQSAPSKDEKLEFYRRTLRYLERVSPAYDHEPRTFIYRAVSHFRLGNQKEAEQAIDQAITLAVDDPDAFYCRAEINQRTNVDQSLKDLQVYIDMTREFRARGAVLSEAKERRVIRMRDHLLAVKAGKASNAEIFDPVEAEGDPLADPADQQQAPPAEPAPEAPKPAPEAPKAAP